MVYAGLHKVSCDMHGGMDGWDFTIRHKDGTSAQICAVCYGKCLAHPPFNKGVEAGEITVTQRT